MDRTSRIGLGICLVLFIFLFQMQEKYLPKKLPPKPTVAASTNAAPQNPPSLTAQQPASGQSSTPAPTAPTPPAVEGSIKPLENDAVKTTFTSAGAAIKHVELKLQKADNGGNIILNQEARTNVMTLSGWPGADTANFTAQVDPGQAITFTTTLPD